jgi:hypothetical protein
LCLLLDCFLFVVFKIHWLEWTKIVQILLFFSLISQLYFLAFVGGFSKQYLIMTFTVFFFKYDYRHATETFLIDYFFISIIFVKVSLCFYRSPMFKKIDVWWSSVQVIFIEIQKDHWSLSLCLLLDCFLFVVFKIHWLEWTKIVQILLFFSLISQLYFLAFVGGFFLRNFM